MFKFKIKIKYYYVGKIIWREYLAEKYSKYLEKWKLALKDFQIKFGNASIQIILVNIILIIFIVILREKMQSLRKCSKNLNKRALIQIKKTNQSRTFNNSLKFYYSIYK